MSAEDLRAAIAAEASRPERPADDARTAERLDQGRRRLIDWLQSHKGEWLSTSDHRVAQRAGLTDADQGMTLLALLESEGLVEVERRGDVRRFRYVGTPAARATRALVDQAGRVFAARTPTVRPKEEPVPPPLQTYRPNRLTLSAMCPAELHARAAAAAAAAGQTRSDWLTGLIVARLDAVDPATEAMRPTIAAAAERARAEGCDVVQLLVEVIQVGLALRDQSRAARAFDAARQAASAGAAS